MINAQDSGRQIQGMLVAGVRRDDFYIDLGLSGALSKRPGLDRLVPFVIEEKNIVKDAKKTTIS